MAAVAAQREIRTTFNAAPFFVQGTLQGESKAYTITPILLRDREEVISFLSTNSSKYLRDGTPMSMERAARRVDQLIKRHNDGDPWSGYLLRERNGALAGMWVVGYDDIDGDLNVSLQIKDEFQRDGLGLATWRWTVEQFLPYMTEMDVKVKGKSAMDAFIRATTHPDHLTETLKKAGFKYVKEYVDHDYAKAGINDGRRILYQISVKALLGEK